MRRLLSFSGVAALAAAIWLLPAPLASAVDTPPETGCPASFEVIAVTDLDPAYVVPALIDAEGNNNGLICAKQLSAGAQEQFCRKIGGCTLPIIYQFREDSSPAKTV